MKEQLELQLQNDSAESMATIMPDPMQQAMEAEMSGLIYTFYFNVLRSL